MFELDENSEDDMISLIMDEFDIQDQDNRRDLRPILQSIADGTRTEFEATIRAYIALYVVRQQNTCASNWQAYVTESNLDTFISDSVLIMCSEAAHLAAQPWMQKRDGTKLDLLSDFTSFLGDQFIEIFEP